MARTVYVAALEQGTGKSAVALGVMEMLVGLVGRVGFFRPLGCNRSGWSADCQETTSATGE